MKIVSVWKCTCPWTDEDMLRTQSTALSTKNLLPLSSETDIRKKKVAWMDIFWVGVRRCNYRPSRWDCLRFSRIYWLCYVRIYYTQNSGAYRIRGSRCKNSLRLPYVHKFISSTQNTRVSLVNLLKSSNFGLWERKKKIIASQSPISVSGGSNPTLALSIYTFTEVGMACQFTNRDTFHPLHSK